MTESASPYQGSELELFAEAHRWKSYLRERLARHLRGDVLEVGSGIGSTTKALCTPAVRSWTALEPDPVLSQLAVSADGDSPITIQVRHRVGTLADLEPRPSFDTIAYVDVLEHIADDRGELEKAAEILRPSGRLVVLAPAHQWLFTPFDSAIGHYRRYGRAALRSLTPPTLELEHLYFLDSAGLLASAGNRLFLRSAQPTLSQIKLWDRVLVPISRVLDPLLGRRVGKSIVAIWVKRA